MRLPSLRPLALLLLLTACRKDPDEQRLEDALDSLPVHLYLAAKAALTGTAPPTPAGGQPATAPAAQPARAEGAGKDGAVTLASLTARAEETLGGAMRSLSERGKALYRADRDGAVPPVLPSLLANVSLTPGLREALDAQTEHAVLLSVFSVLKLHPDTPVPFPSDVVLYEAVRLEPERVRIPGFSRQLRALKAYTYAMNGYCDLALREVEPLDGTGRHSDPRALAAGLGLVSGKVPALSAEQVAHLDGLPHALGYGSVAICYSLRGAEDKGRGALAEFLDGCDRRGVDAPELQLLRAYVECTGGEAQKGQARLAALVPRTDLDPEAREDLALLREHCAAGKAEPLAEVVSASRLARAVARVSAAHLERSGAATVFREAAWLQPVRRFGDFVGGTLASVPGVLPDAPGLLDAARVRLRTWLE